MPPLSELLTELVPVLVDVGVVFVVKDPFSIVAVMGFPSESVNFLRGWIGVFLPSLRTST